MTADPFSVDPAEAMLAELAGLDLSLARHVHACAMATEDPNEVAELARAYQRIARSARQSLALHGRLKRERERAERETPPPRPPPPRDAPRIARRQDDLRAPLRRLIWAEHERPDDVDPDEDLAGYHFDLLERRLETCGEDSTFGLLAAGRGWEVEPLDDHVERLARDLGLPEDLARAWRDLPDPPPEALAPADDEDAPDAVPARPPPPQSSA